MKKIMFSDKYGLTDAVLSGKKTMTRRIINLPDGIDGIFDWSPVPLISIRTKDGDLRDVTPAYEIGEVVAVALSYEDVFNESMQNVIPHWSFADDHCDDAGWTNKMFVRADAMPHHIRITDIKIERLQSISDEDCLKEGILKKSDFPKKKSFPYYFAGGKHEWDNSFSTPRKAFAALIDKINGKGTWERNPWVFAYTFKIID